MQPAEGNKLVTMITLIKKDMDFLMMQLIEGDYASTDTFANNWQHFTQAFGQVNERLSAPGVIEFIARVDHLLAADLIATGRAISMMNNFMYCADKKTRQRTEIYGERSETASVLHIVKPVSE